jgi:hypothetical protein
MLLPVLTLAAICLQPGARCQSGHGSNAATPSVQAPKDEPPVAARVELPACPPAGVPAMQTSQGIGHHKVKLSWNASVQVSGQSAVDGYCVYRSKKQNAAQQKATCSACERVTAVAVAGTACIDDLVEDGMTYYYVVTAVKDNQASSSSNEVVAIIPAGAQSDIPPAPLPPAPFCRGKSMRDATP